MTDLLWRMFEKSGYINNYLFYKALNNMEEINGTGDPSSQELETMEGEAIHSS